MVSQISLVRSQNRAEGLRKAVALLKSNPVQGKAIVLKPNFNSADLAPGSTHRFSLSPAIRKVKPTAAQSGYSASGLAC